jgi:nicotinamide-nucleotide amidase
MTCDVPNELAGRAQRLGERLLARGERVTTAESCTGGLIAAAITSIAGSSNWFDYGFVTYANAAKSTLLGVAPTLIATHGAVSEATAAAMATGALRVSGAHWAIAVSGIAGPTGGTPTKPVGTVCFAWASPAGVTTATYHLPGDRAAVRVAAAALALEQLVVLLEKR